MKSDLIILYPIMIVVTIVVGLCINIDYNMHNPFNLKLIIPYTLLIIVCIISLMDHTNIEQWGKKRWDQFDLEKQEDIRQIAGIVVGIGVLIYIILVLMMVWSLPW